MGGKCHRCGWQEHQAALVQHHVNPAKKAFNFSRNLTVLPWERLRAEAKKCILLCRNCHAVIHVTDEAFYFNEDNIPDYDSLLQAAPEQEQLCGGCGRSIPFTATRCRSCSGRHRAPARPKIIWPSLAALEGLIKDRGRATVAQELGISYSTLCRHLQAVERNKAHT